jgi:hypothetical protein
MKRRGDAVANASSADVRTGWLLFRSDPNITLDSLNGALVSKGRGKVSERMFGHYRHLVSHGYDRYISINRFDVARAARPYEGESASPRYPYYATQRSVTVFMTRPEGVFEIQGHAEQVGEVGALLLFEGAETIAGLRRSRLNADDYVQLRFDDQDRLVAARIVSRETDELESLVEVEFTRLQPISEFVETTVTGTEPIRILIQGSTPSDRAADLIGRRIYYLLEALESARAMANEVLDEDGRTQFEVVASPQIRQLQLVNPLVFDLTMTSVIGAIVGGAWKVLQHGPKAYADVLEARAGHKERTATARKIDAETRRVDAEVDRMAVGNELAREELTTQRVLHTVARKELKRISNAEPSERFNVLQATLLSNLESLRRQDVRELEVQAGSSPGDPGTGTI